MQPYMVMLSKFHKKQRGWGRFFLSGGQKQGIATLLDKQVW